MSYFFVVRMNGRIRYESLSLAACEEVASKLANDDKANPGGLLVPSIHKIERK